VYSKDDYDADSIRAFIVTACRAFGSKIILVDNISAIARSEMLNADVGNYMKLFNALAKELQCHIIIISHTSRTVNVDSSTMDATALMQLGFGSSAIEKFAWNVILLQRKPEDLTATVQVLKNREIGPKGCGKFITAYDDNSWTLVEAPVNSYAGDSTVNVSVNTVG
jgi:RecA-family ATPase